jgi:hypothetical protein
MTGQASAGVDADTVAKLAAHVIHVVSVAPYEATAFVVIIVETPLK